MVDVGGGQARGQRVERVLRPGRDRELRRVDRRQIEGVAEEGAQRVGGQRDREHAARGYLVHQAAAQVDEADAVLERHDAREAGGGVLAHRMTDEGGRGDAPGHPELRQRIFGNHDERQLQARPLQRGVGGRLGALLGQPQRADVIVEQGLEDAEAPVHPVGEGGFRLVEVARHAGVLRAAAGEHERGSGIGHRGVGEHPTGVVLGQQAGGLGGGSGDDDAAPLERAATLVQGIGDVGRRLVGGAQVIGEGGGVGVERRPGTGREGEELEGPVALVAGGRGRAPFPARHARSCRRRRAS